MLRGDAMQVYYGRPSSDVSLCGDASEMLVEEEEEPLLLPARALLSIDSGASLEISVFFTKTVAVHSASPSKSTPIKSYPW